MKFSTRPLSGAEVAIGRSVFGPTINYGQVRVDELSVIARIGASGKSGMGITLFHTIHFSRKVSATPGSSDAGWLIHELTHVWQYERVGSQYIGEALHAQRTSGYQYGSSGSYTDDGNGVVLDRRRQAGATLASFNREQQGDIVKHYYMRKSNGLDIKAWQPYIDDLQR